MTLNKIPCDEASQVTRTRSCLEGAYDICSHILPVPATVLTHPCRQFLLNPTMPLDYLVRFVQAHETFRKPELAALAALAEIDLEFLFYSEYVRSGPQQ